MFETLSTFIERKKERKKTHSFGAHFVKMKEGNFHFLLIVLVLFLVNGVNGENPYRFFTWKFTYGDIYPLGVKQEVHLSFFTLLHGFWLLSFSGCIGINKVCIFGF